jgi:glutamate synthase domain-containing protein 2
VRKIFYYSLPALWIPVLLIAIFWAPILRLLWLLIPYTAIGLFDALAARHNVLRNYPVIGHLRYMLEFISPEIHQYFIESNTNGRPYSREQRHLVYTRSRAENDTLAFGTQQDIVSDGYEYALHGNPVAVDPNTARVLIGGPDCLQPYLASRLNVSGMSFGALSYRAVKALNEGAKRGKFAHNTGEGGISPYHLRGGDLIFQVGTGYFGCRTRDGHFDPDQFALQARRAEVKMVELKLSQGAKPSQGGIVPASKVSAELARIRGVPEGETCHSPPRHTAFDTPLEMMRFIARLRELSGGKPVGFKLALGQRPAFLSLVRAMLETGITPDFITVDGAEGGTGAAPLELADTIGTPINEALPYVHSVLTGAGLRNRIRIIASGKIVSGFDMVQKLAIGADLCNMARPFMFALGCIQALRCNTNNCPSGVATQDRQRARAIDVEDKGERVARFHQATIKSFYEICSVIGVSNPGELHPGHIWRRMPDGSGRNYSELYTYMEPGALLEGTVPAPYAADWEAARTDRF